MGLPQAFLETLMPILQYRQQQQAMEHQHAQDAVRQALAEAEFGFQKERYGHDVEQDKFRNELDTKRYKADQTKQMLDIFGGIPNLMGGIVETPETKRRRETNDRLNRQLDRQEKADAAAERRAKRDDFRNAKKAGATNAQAMAEADYDPEEVRRAVEMAIKFSEQPVTTPGQPIFQSLLAPVQGPPNLTGQPFGPPNMTAPPQLAPTERQVGTSPPTTTMRPTLTEQQYLNQRDDAFVMQQAKTEAQTTAITDRARQTDAQIKLINAKAADIPTLTKLREREVVVKESADKWRKAVAERNAATAEGRAQWDKKNAQGVSTDWHFVLDASKSAAKLLEAEKKRAGLIRAKLSEAVATTNTYDQNEALYVQKELTGQTLTATEQETREKARLHALFAKNDYKQLQISMAQAEVDLANAQEAADKAQAQVEEFRKTMAGMGKAAPSQIIGAAVGKAAGRDAKIDAAVNSLAAAAAELQRRRAQKK